MTLQSSFLLYLTFCTLIFSSPYSFSLEASNSSTLYQKNVFSMKMLDDPALHEGLAGTFFGKQGSWFLMAGGSSFPEGKPWESGIKHFSDRVFVFIEQADSTFHLIHSGHDMPVALAEGAYASLPEGLLCVGGQTPEGITKMVWLLSFDGSSITVTDYPSLPTPVKHSSVTVIGSRIYLVGGELADGSSSNQFLLLDLDNLDKGWQRLPDFPVPVSGSAITSQQDGEEVALFVLGGRARNNSLITAFYSSVYHFRPSSGVWSQRQNIQFGEEEVFPLAMASASSIGETYILLYGGDNGAVFNQIEVALNKKDEKERDRLQMSHAGFSSKILLYNTLTDSWLEIAETVNRPVAVASDVSDGKDVFIACGEIRPGVRSPYITRLCYR